MSAIFGNTLSLAEQSLDHLWSRQQVTLNNIANNDTPGYKAKYVTFEDELRKRLTAARSGTSQDVSATIRSSRYYVHNTRDESARMDGNNVNVDVENIELVRATLQYQYEISALNGDINRLRSALKA